MPDIKDKIPKYPGIPKPVELTGCSFMGKQLSAQELEEREHRSRAMAEHRKTIDDNVIILRHKHTKATGNKIETRRVSKRTRRFSTNEIRKEYGIMSKPYESKVENILHCILNKGPIDLKGIAVEMGYENPQVATRSLSGPISTLYNCLGHKEPHGINWLECKKDAGRNFYKAVDQTRSVEVMYDKYLEINKQVTRDRIDRRKQHVKNLVAERRQEREEEKHVDIADDSTKQPIPGEDDQMSPKINAAIEQYLKRLLGVTVEVNGTINILFGIKERE